MESRHGRIEDSGVWSWNLVEMKAAGKTDVRAQENVGQVRKEESYVVGFTPVNRGPPLMVLDANQGSQQENALADNGARGDRISVKNKKRSFTDPKARMNAKNLRNGSESTRRNGSNKDQGTRSGTITSVFRLAKDNITAESIGQGPIVKGAIRKEAASHQHLRPADGKSGTFAKDLVSDQAISYAISAPPVLISSDESSMNIPDTPPHFYLEDELDLNLDVDFLPPNSAQDPQQASQSESDEFPFDETDLVLNSTNITCASSSEGTGLKVTDNSKATASPTILSSTPVLLSETYDEITDDMEDFVQMSRDNFDDVDLGAFEDGELDMDTHNKKASDVKQSSPEKPGLTFLPPKLYTPAKSTSVGTKSSPTLIELEWAPAKVTSMAPPRPRSSTKASSASTIQANHGRSPQKAPGEASEKTSKPTDKPLASHTITFDANGSALPFVRPPFPKPLRDRSPILGLSSRTYLRTCFRVGEALNAFSVASRSNVDAYIELYARVLWSRREGYKQFFRFGDLFNPAKPPFLNGVFGLWRSSELWDVDSKPFLSSGRDQMCAEGTKKKCRVVGRLKRNEKLEVEMSVLSIWECTWGDVQVAKGVVCA